VPGIRQVSADFFHQRQKPVPLTAAADGFQPFVFLYLAYDAGADDSNRRLESFKISLRPQAKNTPAIRTAEPF